MARSESLSLTKQTDLTHGYITAGDRAYLIGAQNGAFPDLGWHVPGEMGGLWAHPVKLLDGFWLRVDGVWLTDAARFSSGAFWSAHDYELGDLQIVRRQFVPDGEPALIVRYTMRAASDRTVQLRFLARSDLQGVWLSERSGLQDGGDHAVFDPELQAWVIRDEHNPWSVVVGARGLVPVGSACGADLWGPEQTRGQGVSVALDYELPLTAEAEAVIDFVVAGSDAGEATARAAFGRASADPDALWASKAERYERLLASSALEVPDAAIARAWDWIKCNYDWMVRDMPGLGRALGAGAPDYVWLFGCDSAYAVLGCLALGQHEVAAETLDALRRISQQANGESGRVIHEATTRGHVFHPGNTQETPQFVKAVWQTFLWTGDTEFLRRNYPFCRQGLLGWVMGERCAPGEVLPHGSGIMEVAGLDLQMIDVAAYTAEALEALAGMADVLGDLDVAARSRQLAGAVCRRLEAAFWIEEEGMYGDLLATPREIAPRLRELLDLSTRSQYVDHARPGVREAYGHLLARAEADPQQDVRRPWLLKNWIVITPLEAGLTPPHRAARLLARAESDEFTGPWGMYLNGIEQAAAMSINTGVLAVAELNYGRPDQALARVRSLAETLERHMPGAVPEILPDSGCFVQAWSGYGIAWPVVSQVFGLRPRAHERRLLLRPCFPAGWTRASLKGVRVGTNRFDLSWDGAVLTVASQEDGWAVEAEGVRVRHAAP
ncbi:hypothetical protein [Symbiobacterium terraclitae]|uniref:hypothetical protein n=1 Tax=Symbiobacterium terraclitae TaxID=557451 RepID=UPI0035B527D1